jgi:3-deoxy-D-arabino-heptulosonate 7-phosphate (DAHP) synthase class II
MAASVLKSDKAAQMNIAIVRAFIALRKFAANYKELAEQIDEIRKNVSNHSEQLNQIYTAIENLLYEKTMQKEWEDRHRIGFKNK